MGTLKVKKDFTLNGESYIVGDEIKVEDIKTARMLNEKGFVNPLTYRDLVILERELKNVKAEKEE